MKAALLVDTTDLFYHLLPRRKKIHYQRTVDGLLPYFDINIAYAFGHSSRSRCDTFKESLDKMGYIVDFVDAPATAKYLPLCSSKLLSTSLEIMGSRRAPDCLILGICNKWYGELLGELNKYDFKYSLLTVQGAGILQNPAFQKKDNVFYILDDWLMDIKGRPYAAHTPVENSSAK